MWCIPVPSSMCSSLIVYSNISTEDNVPLWNSPWEAFCIKQVGFNWCFEATDFESNVVLFESIDVAWSAFLFASHGKQHKKKSSKRNFLNISTFGASNSPTKNLKTSQIPQCHLLPLNIRSASSKCNLGMSASMTPIRVHPPKMNQFVPQKKDHLKRKLNIFQAYFFRVYMDMLVFG